MTIPKINLQNIGLQTAADKPASSRVAIWGLPLAAVIIAIAALLLVWFRSDFLGIPSGAPRVQVLASIPIALVAIVVAHLFAVSTGAYMGAARLFRRERGADGASSTDVKPLKRDARLQRVCEELRISHGLIRRRRVCWLLVNGTDERVNQVAPGLKQAGVMLVGEAVLVHASPDGIEAARWLDQIRQLHRRRPVDYVVHVARADDADTDLPRKLSTIGSALGWAAPVALLHPVPAKGTQPETFDAIGAFAETFHRGTAQANGLRERLAGVELHTADEGVRLCSAHGHMSYLAQVSAYIGEQRERIVAGWETLRASHWLRAPLAGVMFAPVFAPAVATPTPTAVPAAVDGQAMAAAAFAPLAYPRQPAALLPTWAAIAGRRGIGRRVGFYWPNVLAMIVTAAAIAAGELISLCAHKLGINLTAAKGKFTASALTDGMDLFAQNQLRVASASADIQLAAKTKIALNSGGASLEIEGGNVTFHCPSSFTIKAASFTFVGPDNVPTQLPSLPKSSLKISDPYSSSH